MGEFIPKYTNKYTSFSSDKLKRSKGYVSKYTRLYEEKEDKIKKNKDK